MPTIATRLNADPARTRPPDAGGWTPQAIDAMLRNPKYTGHMVYGRRRNRRPSRPINGCGPPNPSTP